MRQIAPLLPALRTPVASGERPTTAPFLAVGMTMRSATATGEAKKRFDCDGREVVRWLRIGRPPSAGSRFVCGIQATHARHGDVR